MIVRKSSFFQIIQTMKSGICDSPWKNSKIAVICTAGMIMKGVSCIFPIREKSLPVFKYHVYFTFIYLLEKHGYTQLYLNLNKPDTLTVQYLCMTFFSTNSMECAWERIFNALWETIYQPTLCSIGHFPHKRTFICWISMDCFSLVMHWLCKHIFAKLCTLD